MDRHIIVADNARGRYKGARMGDFIASALAPTAAIHIKNPPMQSDLDALASPDRPEYDDAWSVMMDVDWHIVDRRGPTPVERTGFFINGPSGDILLELSGDDLEGESLDGEAF